jgi:hypothetical protein
MTFIDSVIYVKQLRLVPLPTVERIYFFYIQEVPRMYSPRHSGTTLEVELMMQF